MTEYVIFVDSEIKVNFETVQYKLYVPFKSNHVIPQLIISLYRATPISRTDLLQLCHP